MTGRARHRDAHALRHTLERLGELFRRAGGDLPGAEGAAIRTELGKRLAHVASLADFSRVGLALDVEQFVKPERRRVLDALPAWVDVAGERCPIDYEVQDGVATARLRLRERAARQLQARDVPDLDRPVGFTVLRGKRPALRIDTLVELRRLVNAPETDRPRPGRAKKHRRRL